MFANFCDLEFFEVFLLFIYMFFGCSVFTNLTKLSLEIDYCVSSALNPIVHHSLNCVHSLLDKLYSNNHINLCTHTDVMVRVLFSSFQNNVHEQKCVLKVTSFTMKSQICYMKTVSRAPVSN